MLFLAKLFWEESEGVFFSSIIPGSFALNPFQQALVDVFP